MQTENRLLDDLARLAGGAFASVAALKDEAEARLQDRLERVLDRMDLVRRDEFDAVRAMATKAREENEALAARLAALEGKARGAKRPRARAKGAGKRAPRGKGADAA